LPDEEKGRHVSHRRSVVDGPGIEKSRSRFVNAVCRRFIALCLAAAVAGAHPAWAGIEDAIKAIQSGDVAAAEKGLQVLVKERDPRAQFLLGLYVYGNPDSKMFDLTKAAPLLLDASERGYVPAMVPLAGAYAEGKGMPKSMFESYKWLAIAERWNSPNAGQLIEQVSRELKPDEIEKAKAAAASYSFKTK
jgi:hypothetical protein